MKVLKLLRKGCRGYLCCILTESSDSPSVETIATVCEFPNVFPNNLPGDLIDGKIEFIIDIIPGTQPISKTPYRMSTSELKELKSQLQELPDKKFIHPSTSPWGVPVLFALGTELRQGSAYHPQTDGQFKRTIKTLEDILRMYVLDFQGNWDTYLPLAEFVYNNSHHLSIGMVPYEALYGRKFRSLIYWAKVGDRSLLGLELVQEAIEKVKLIQQ
ncbi:uncharacterized protein LOC114312453 [Camellia sinensis]|uniref:uncharacterized protein LOC114312453 n=1 Tax=Camellia sinensis TaxID=4442 RepID=UPI001036816C|nr:uncharacterized protein LOC114312453 [Camellia sinensis]